MKDFSHKSNLEVDQVMGAFFLLEQIYLIVVMDLMKGVFVYFEEVDLSKRIKTLVSNQCFCKM